MFGLTFEKLFVVALLAAVIIGPHRLPLCASRFADTVRNLRSAVDTARLRAEEESGLALAQADWEALDPRRYDPRRIIREAWDAPASAIEPAEPETPAPGRWVVVGTSGHPRRVWKPDYEVSENTRSIPSGAYGEG